MVKLSAPTPDTMALVTYPFMPWISDTTAMIDVTATMFPRTVRNDRSLFAQMALIARPTASQKSCMSDEAEGILLGRSSAGSARGRFDFHRAAIAQFPDRREWTDDDLIAFFESRQHLEILFTGNAGLHGNERGLLVPDDEDAFELLALLPRLQLGGFDPSAAGTPALVVGIAHDVALLVDHHFADGHRLDRDTECTLARCGRDVRGARESGPDIGNGAVEFDLDEKVRRRC